MFKSWLWPNRTIGKKESQQLRDEHNALVNAHSEVMQALEECAELLNVVWQYDGDVFGIHHNDATDIDFKVRHLISEWKTKETP